MKFISAMNVILPSISVALKGLVPFKLYDNPANKNQITVLRVNNIKDRELISKECNAALKQLNKLFEDYDVKITEQYATSDEWCIIVIKPNDVMWDSTDLKLLK